MSDYNARNYTEQGGEVTHIGGVLKFDEGGGIEDFPGLDNMNPVTGNQVKDVKDAFNALLIGMKNAGLMEADDWNLSVLACRTPSAMPTSETAANSEHASFYMTGTKIDIDLNCLVSQLADANHGETWGTHKWLGFGVRTGLDSIVGVKFTDDTGAVATLSAEDAAEAEALGLSAGDFVLYIKAEDPKYLTGEKSFTLWADGMKVAEYTMQIYQSKPDNGGN